MKMNKKVTVNAKIGSELDFLSREAFNLLRTNVKFAVPKHEGCRIIATTSACPQEGKSCVTVNLAFALAQSGERVLLIDADMRCPTIASKIGIASTPGLSNALIGESLDAIVQRDVLCENLSVIPAGDVPPNPSELLGSDMMVALLSACAQKYDYVLIDLPPVLAVADPIILSPKVDGVIVIVRHARTHRRDLTESVRQLKFANASILGFVYNGEPCERTTHYYKTYYKSKQ